MRLRTTGRLEAVRQSGHAWMRGRPMSDMKRREFMILLGGATACRSRRPLWQRACAASLPDSSACGERQVCGADLNCSGSVGIHRFSVRIGRVDPARFDFERVHGRDDHIDGHLSTLMASGPLTNVCSWLRQNKSPVYAGIFCPRFRSMHRQIGRPVRPQIHTFRPRSSRS